MNAESQSASPAANAGTNLRVKILGVGTAGSVMVDQLHRAEFSAAGLAFINTDASGPSGPTKQILLDTTPLRGLGTGGDPERGRKLAEDNFAQLTSLTAATDVVFLVSGLGGGTGSGVLPVLARAARESGALVLAFVTLPFDCEGNRRQQQAQAALEALQSVCDGVLCLPNQKAFQLLDAKSSFADTFRATTVLLTEGLRGVWRLLMHRGLIEIHFAELCALLRERHGESYYAMLEAHGPNRTSDVIAKVSTHPLLDGGKVLEDAASVLVSILGGSDLTMADVNQVMQDVTARCPHARVIMGAAVNPEFAERLAVTLVVTRPSRSVKNPAPRAVEMETPAAAAEFGAELLHPTEVGRAKTRLVPPAPALTLEQREEIISKHTGKATRVRKATTGPRMRQTTLPLDIVNKGRFDKSEPTIHKGEDLDLPTYVRRGIALN